MSTSDWLWSSQEPELVSRTGEVEPRFARHLLAFGLRVVGCMRGCAILEMCPDEAYPGLFEYWLLSDNGGEYNVEKINAGGMPTSIPVSFSRGFSLCRSTFATWIRAVIDGKPVDYNMGNHEEMDKILDRYTPTVPEKYNWSSPYRSAD